MKLGKIHLHRPAAHSLRVEASFVRSLLRFCMWTIIGFFSLLFVGSTVGYFVVQSEWFHRWSAQKLNAIISDELEAKLEFSSIRFDIFKGIELDSVRLTTQGDTLLQARSLRLYYELEPLLIRRIVIRSVAIEQADIRLLRSTQDSTWNVDHVVKPTPTDPNKKAFDWGIYVRNVSLSNARLQVCDSLSSQVLPQRIHFTRTTLDSLNLSLSASLNLAAKEYGVSIDNLRFIEQRSGFKTETLRLAVKIDSTQLRILNMRVISPGMNLLLHGSVDSTNIFDPAMDFASRPLHIDVEQSRLDSKDLNWFLPPDFSLAESFDVKTQIRGNLTKMHFDVDQVRTQQTDLHGHLTIENVANAKPFVYIVDLRHSQANISDVKRALPTLALSNIEWLNGMRFDDTRVYGVKDSMYATIKMHASFGGVEGWSKLVMRGPLRYDSELNLSSFDTYPFTKKYSASSRLNGRVELHGSGTTLDEVAAHVLVSLNSSSFGGHDLSSMTLRADVASRVLHLDSLFIDFPMSSSDSLAADFENWSESIRAAGTLDLSNTSMPVYTTSINLIQLPLARLAGDANLPVALSAGLELQGQGFDIDSLQCSLKSDVRDFIMKDGALFPFRFNADLIRQDEQHRELKIRSDIADADVKGRFKLGSAWSVFLVHIGMMDRYVRNQYAQVQTDSIRAPHILPFNLTNDTLDLRYSVRLQGMSALAPFIKGVRLDAKGFVQGSISGSPSCYQFVVDTAKVQRFSMHMDDNFVYSQPLTMSLRLQTENMTTQPYLEQADLSMKCDSVFRINATRYVRPRADIQILDDHMRFDVGTRIENHIPVRAIGRMITQNRAFRIELDSLHAGWTRSLAFSSAGPSALNLSQKGVYVQGLKMKLDDGPDRIGLDGQFNATRFDSVRVVLSRFDVSTLKRVPELIGIDALQMLKGRVDTLSFVINDLYAQPHFAIDAQLSELRYNDVMIGVQQLNVAYDGRQVSGNSSVRATVKDSVKTLTIDVLALPLDIALSPVKMSLRNKENVGIAIRANRLSLAAVSPFVPGIANLNGRGDAQLDISGTTPDNIDYRGSVVYDTATFIVPATNMRYSSKGKLSLMNTTVSLDTINVYNIGSDHLGGEATVLGLMHIRGFNIRDLDIHVEIDSRHGFQVMSEATAATNEIMYGRTIISTQDNDRKRTQKSLHFHGSPEMPILEGFVMLEDADVKFPPTISRTTRTSSFQYKKVGSKYMVTEVFQNKSNGDTTVGDLPPENPVLRSADRKLGRSFTDILYTDMFVKIKDRITVQMDFGFNDQLVAVVKQETKDEAMHFIRIGNDSTSLKSDLIVDPASTYKFYGNFNASGRMNIDGPIDNPKLNLTATYANDRVINDKKSRYEVILKITGTKKTPKLEMDYTIDGNFHPNAVGETEITTNAVLLTLFGYTQLELSGNTGSAGNTSVNSIKASTVGVILNRMLQGGVIKNVNIDFNGGVGDLSQARLQITAGLYGANVTLGGTVADPTVTIDVALGSLLGFDVVAQYMRATNPGVSATRQQKQWEVRVGASFP